MNNNQHDYKNLPFLTQGNFAEIIDLGFKLYIKHFKSFFVVSLLSYIPFYLLFLINQAFFIVSGASPEAGCLSGFLSLLVPNNPLVWMGSALIIYNTGLYILGKENSIPNSYKTMKHYLFRVIVWNVGFAVVTGILLFLFFLIIPPFIAIFLSFTLSFVLYSIVLEDKDLVTAVHRSYGMVTRNFWKFLLVIVFTYSMSFIPGIVYATFIGGVQTEYSWIYLLVNVGSAFITVIVTPMAYIIRTFLFFDIKMREEGTDLYLGAQKLEQETQFTREDYNKILQQKYKNKTNET